MNLDVPVAMLNKERQNTQVRVSYDPFTHEYIPSRSRLNMGLGPKRRSQNSTSAGLPYTRNHAQTFALEHCPDSNYRPQGSPVKIAPVSASLAAEVLMPRSDAT
jgi:hypothetical protein